MGTDKLWAELCGQPLVSWPLRAFAASDAIDDLIVAVSRGTMERMARLVDDLRIDARLVVGGARRQDSVRAALDAVPETEWVVIHDGARPLLSAALINDGLAAAAATGAAIAGVPVVDTVKEVRDGVVHATLDRDRLWAVQTPQVFRTSLLAAAHAACSDDVTDDAALVEALGTPVRVYVGTYENLKVTTLVDLQVAAALIARGSGGAGSSDARGSGGSAPSAR